VADVISPPFALFKLPFPEKGKGNIRAPLLFAHFFNTQFANILFLNAVTQGAILLFQGHAIKTPAMHPIGIGPIGKDLFAKLWITDLFHLPLITPGSRTVSLARAPIVYRVIPGNGWHKKKQNTDHYDNQNPPGTHIHPSFA
jgi:hypothetical protein